jgi:hypothetical protein
MLSSAPASTLKIRRPHVWLAATLALVLLGAGVALVIRARRTPPIEETLLAAPGDSWLVATVDVLAALPLIRPWLESSGGVAGLSRAAGLGTLSAACGFEPLEHVREVMVALPEGGERGDFGVAVWADLSMAELGDCARKAIVARGGNPSTSARGAFSVIADDSRPGQARLAYRPGGPFLVGRGAWLEAMIDAADGRAERARSPHAALRRALVPEGAPAAALVVTAVLPRAVRDRIKGEMLGEGSRPNEALAGVLGVGDAGAALTVNGQPGSVTALEAQLHCETPEGCRAVKKLLEQGRLALSRDLGARLLGLGPLIDTLSVDIPDPPPSGNEAGTTVDMRAHGATADLTRLAGHLLDRPPPLPSLASAAPAPAPAPASASASVPSVSLAPTRAHPKPLEAGAP